MRSQGSGLPASGRHYLRALRLQPLAEAFRLAFGARTQSRQPIAAQLQRGAERLQRPSASSCSNMRRGSSATPAPLRRPSPRSARNRTPARALHTADAGRLQPAWPFVAAVERNNGSVARSRGCFSRRANAGAQRRERGIQDRRAGLSLPVAITEADRQVQPFAGQVDAVVVGLQAQFDVRVRRLERGQPWGQPVAKVPTTPSVSTSRAGPPCSAQCWRRCVQTIR